LRIADGISIWVGVFNVFIVSSALGAQLFLLRVYTYRLLAVFVVRVVSWLFLKQFYNPYSVPAGSSPTSHGVVCGSANGTTGSVGSCESRDARPSTVCRCVRARTSKRLAKAHSHGVTSCAVLAFRSDYQLPGLAIRVGLCCTPEHCAHLSRAKALALLMTEQRPAHPASIDTGLMVVWRDGPKTSGKTFSIYYFAVLLLAVLEQQTFCDGRVARTQICPAGDVRMPGT
jgi:hypothetical protein